MIKIIIDEKTRRVIDDYTKHLEKKSNEVIKKAINETTKEMKSNIMPEVKKNYTAKSGVKSESEIKVNKSKLSNLTSLIIVSGKPVSLKKGFPIKKNSKRIAVRTRILSASPLKPLELKSGRIKAFVAQMKNKHIGVFQQKPGQKIKGKNKEAIKEMFGMSLPKMVENEKVVRELENEAFKTLNIKLHKFMTQTLKG